MKRSNYWDDNTLLDYEPFRSAFSDRAKLRGNGNSEQWRTRVLEKVQNVPEIDDIVKGWYSSLPEYARTPKVRSPNERIRIFFDFYHKFSDKNTGAQAALNHALQQHALRHPRPNTNISSKETSATEALVSESQTGQNRANPPKLARGTSHDLITNTQAKIATSHQGADTNRQSSLFNQAVKAEKYAVDQKTSLKRRASGSLPRNDVKRQAETSLSGNASQQPPMRMRTKNAIIDAYRLASPAATTLQAASTSSNNRAVGIPEQKATTKQVKQEQLETVLPLKELQHPASTSVPAMPSGRRKRRREEDESDNDFDTKFNKRRVIKDRHGRVLLPTPKGRPDAPKIPEQHPLRSKPRKTPDLSESVIVKSEPGHVDLLHVPDNQAGPSKTISTSPGVEVESQNNNIWAKRLRTRGSFSERTISPRSQSDPLGETGQLAVSSQPESSDGAPLAEAMQVDSSDAISMFSSPIVAGVELRVALFPKCLENGAETDSISQGSSLLSSPPQTSPGPSFAEPEDMKDMTLVSNTFVHPPVVRDSMSNAAECIQPLEMKPPLVSLPPIWAQSRQEVCESFDWFRSYQGGVYHVDDYVKGYLLSGFPASRDRFEHGGRLIISHGGGRAESLHSSKGNSVAMPATDQLAADKSVRALINNYLHNRPLALLIDDKYALFPYDLGAKDVAYAVLGFYTVAYAWAEYQNSGNELGRVVRYKFAFRWCEEQGEPWWLAKSNSDILNSNITDVNNGLEAQGTTSIEQGPILDALAANTVEPHLAARPHMETDVDSNQLTVNRGAAGSNMDQGLDDAPLLMPCSTCGKESPKVFSASWACLNADCQNFWRQTQSEVPFEYLPTNLAYEPRFLSLPESRSIPLGFGDIKPSLPLHDSERESATGTMTDYHFTRGFHCLTCGRLSCRSQWEQWECLSCGSLSKPLIPIRLAIDLANQSMPISYNYFNISDIADVVSCPETTFLQQGGRGYLQTFVLPHGRGRIHHIQARTRAAKFTADAIFNDYQEHAASGQLKFRRWPMRAHKCRGALLTNYFSHNAGAPYKYVGGDANTVTFDQAPAVCKARDLIQQRISEALGISSNFNEVLSAAYMERQKMAFHSDNEVGLGPLVAGLSLGSPALMHFRIHARHDPQREQRGILLSIVLRHGDVLVMDGAGVQDFYEHTVVPNNFRIAATARQIGVSHS